jgi:hypothetical protein
MAVRDRVNRSLLKRVTRRSLLQRVGALGAGAAVWPGGPGDRQSPASAGPELQQDPPPRDPPLSLTLVFSDGRPALRFSQSAASSIGEYAGSLVRQQCLRQRQGPWTVFFRPDTHGSRQEIVVEYGTEYTFFAGREPVPLSRMTPAHITAPYIATISGGGVASPVRLAVPNHWWGARWRWQSAPRPLMRAYAHLLAMRAVLPLSTMPLWNTVPPPATPWDGPMSTGDLDTFLAGTGDRDELGFTTEQQACYLLTGDAGARESMLTDAEASGTMIYHIRDAATGAPFSVESYSNMALVNNAGPPGFAIPTARISNASNYFIMDEGVAHMPALGFVPWLLTDDPFFLEEAQFAANYAMIESNYFNINDGLPGLVGDLQTRGWAWGMRDLFRMAAFAPVSPPAWLAPQGYWRRCVANNLTFAGRYLAATASPCTRVFKLIPETGWYESFMVDYLGVVMGWAGWSGLFPAWANVIRYASGPRIAMSDNSGALGWDHRFPVPYLVPVFDGHLGARATDLNSDYTVPASSDTPTSWAQLWADYQLYAASPTGGDVPGWTNPSTWAPGTLQTFIYLNYCPEARAALAALQLAGIAKASAEHTWLYEQLVSAMPEVTYPSRYKWAIWPH